MPRLNVRFSGMSKGSSDADKVIAICLLLIVWAVLSSTWAYFVYGDVRCAVDKCVKVKK